MRRVLWISDPVETDHSDVRRAAGERAFGWSVMFSGVRCILQYAVLPFVLPLIGISMEVATPLLLVMTVVAMASIFFSLRRFWQINYRYRWQYLVVAVAALVILAALLLQDVGLIRL